MYLRLLFEICDILWFGIFFFFFINSASCRKPIKGAASRPIEHSDFIMEECFSKYAPKYGTSTDIKLEKPPTKKRSIPLWIKVLLFVVISVFLFSVYQSMETNQGNPFSEYLSIIHQGGANWVFFWKAHPIWSPIFNCRELFCPLIGSRTSYK